MVSIANIFPVPTPIWVGCISKRGTKARNVPEIFKRFPRHSLFTIPWNYNVNLTLTQHEMQTEWTFLQLFHETQRTQLIQAGSVIEFWHPAEITAKKLHEPNHSLINLTMQSMFTVKKSVHSITVNLFVKSWNTLLLTASSGCVIDVVSVD